MANPIKNMANYEAQLQRKLKLMILSEDLIFMEAECCVCNFLA